MRNDTRIKYDAFTTAIAKLNGVDKATVRFSVEPRVQQTLETVSYTHLTLPTILLV